MNQNELKKLLRSNDLVAIGKAVESGDLKTKTYPNGRVKTWIPKKTRGEVGR